MLNFFWIGPYCDNYVLQDPVTREWDIYYLDPIKDAAPQYSEVEKMNDRITLTMRNGKKVTYHYICL